MKKHLDTIRSGESETVEFKTGFDREVIETLVAFANTKGGRVYIGVTDKGEVAGVSPGKESVQNWLNQIKQSTDQNIVPDAETATVNGRTIVIFSVPESPIKPLACKGRYYKRVGNSNHQLASAEVVNLHLRTFNTSWDFHTDDIHTKKDISLKKVRAFIKQANAHREAPIQDDPMTVLQKLELIRDGKLTYACFLLFMKEESSLSTIELGRFQTPIIIKDGSRLKTDLFAEVAGVMQFIQKHINKAYIITGKPQRDERWDYPLDAMREIVINAIIHRDYRNAQDSVVKIYDDRIEVFNPGGLPDGLTVAKLLKGDYISNVRNKKIADTFKAAGLIEKYGSGIKRILNAFKAYGLPAPAFEETCGGFMVTAYKKTVAQSGVESEQVTGQVTGQVVKLLSIMNGEMSRSALQQTLGLRHRDNFVDSYVQPAQESELIEMTIPDKPKSRLQKYRLTEKGKKLLEKLKK